ncbi:MAG: hypothetical protein Q9163_004826 [Psora crenata]
MDLIRRLVGTLPPEQAVSRANYSQLAAAASATCHPPFSTSRVSPAIVPDVVQLEGPIQTYLLDSLELIARLLYSFAARALTNEQVAFIGSESQQQVHICRSAPRRFGAAT